MAIHLFRSVSVVTYKLIELNKTCMAAILKALSTVMNENKEKRSILKIVSDVVTLGTFCYRDKSFINRRGVGVFFHGRRLKCSRT